MKAKCKICNRDLSVEIDSMFENFTIGRTTCKNCGSIQKRYISEGDLLLYLSCEETLYTAVTIYAAHAYDNLTWTTGIICLLLLVATYIIQKYISRYIYANAPFKKKVSEKVLDEDKTTVKKNISIQFSLFFIFAFCFILSKDMRVDFGIALVLDIIVSVLRCVLAIRKEIE